MALDELEAVRLADLEGLYQEQAAARMGVSRPTFGRILMSAHRKVAEALVAGKMLRIEGGQVACPPASRSRCRACQLEWAEPHPEHCPRCQRANRSDESGSACADAESNEDADRAQRGRRQETAT